MPVSFRPLPAGFMARPIAHRGLHLIENGLVENTRTAFDAAITGRYGIECDIQASADGEAMVFHDFLLDRLTEGAGRTDNLPAAQLRTLAFKVGTDRMETLADLFAQVAGRVPLVVEIKSRFDGDGRIATRVAALARDYAGPLVFKSFDPAKLVALREAGVMQPLGIVGESDYSHGEYDHLSAEEKRALANLLHFGVSRPDFISWNHKDLPSAGPYLARSQLGMPVMSWTIRSQEAADKVAPHVDQIVFERFTPA
ncbi:MAG: glycerophosphoryl diester [Beijerinckiaceae bacterium]|nr:MAG: glycerophosphoryl diester [Beijerinckiaceae bacterium]